MSALESQNNILVDLLLKNGADVNITMERTSISNCKSAVDITLTQILDHAPHYLELLLEHGAALSPSRLAALWIKKGLTEEEVLEDYPSVKQLLKAVSE